MEIANQNQINVTQERLDQMKQIKADNAKLLSDIDTKTAALSQASAKFEEYKKSETTKMDDQRKLLARESANHSKLDTVALQNQINELTSQVASLTKENETLKDQVASLQKSA